MQFPLSDCAYLSIPKPCHCCELNNVSEYLSSSASRSSGDNDWPIFCFAVCLGARSAEDFSMTCVHLYQLSSRPVFLLDPL